MDRSDSSSTGSSTALPAWTWLATAVAVALFWTVTMEAGAVSSALGQSGPFLHELFHDGRHLIGVPCH